MICNAAIQYPRQLSIADFREEVEIPQCNHVARFVVHNLRADIDKEFVGVKEKFKLLVFKQMECELRDQLKTKVEELVVPKRQKDEPFEEWLQKPVILDVTDERSLLQLIVNVALDPNEREVDDEGGYHHENVWENVSVKFQTVVKSQPVKVV